METLNDVKKVVREFDPDMDPDSADFKTALLLMSFFVVGPNVSRLKKFCKLPGGFVEQRIDNLKKNAVIADDESFKVQWLDEENGGISFLLDCQVADGLIERSPGSDEDGEYSYKMTPEGNKWVEDLLKK